jgi:hypothetical protein
MDSLVIFFVSEDFLETFISAIGSRSLCSVYETTKTALDLGKGQAVPQMDQSTE